VNEREEEDVDGDDKEEEDEEDEEEEDEEEDDVEEVEVRADTRDGSSRPAVQIQSGSPPYS
jgi:hypothetical protein